MNDLLSDAFGRDGDVYRNAAPELLAELKQAAKECSGFAELTSSGGARLTQWVNIMDDHDPRANAFNRLQRLHLLAAGICYED